MGKIDSVHDCISSPVNGDCYKEHKVGIVLSGGGALGFAHIGVLQALNENNIYPSIVSGASMGSLVGGFYANGYTPAQIYNTVKSEKLYKLFNIISPTIPLRSLGFSKNNDIKKLLNKYIRHNSFSELKLPLYVSVTNLSLGRVEYYNKGNDLNSMLITSSTIPGVFEVIRKDDLFYVDGGILDNLPVKPIREKCEYIIGINVVDKSEFTNPSHLYGIIIRSYRLMINEISKNSEKQCDILITPNFNNLTSFSFDKFDDIYMIGYNTMKKYLLENPKTVEKLASKK